ALLGAASGFVESTLAQIYKVRDPLTGGFRGGPVLQLKAGLGAGNAAMPVREPIHPAQHNIARVIAADDDFFAEDCG
ncbi:MAG: alanine:cation symporter family protein, partial [Alphaproteobacteria bacterium]|nr:alanine:cation symporter family protein [Alphaproteobacteria bacterium]